MREWQEGEIAFMRFDSVADAVDAFESCESGRDLYTRRVPGDVKWHGGIPTVPKVIATAREGLTDKVPDAMRIAESAVADIEREYDMPSFSSYYDVTGSDVDVARYLSGEPECMIGYEMVATPRAGRVITLTASILASCMVSADDMERRGVQVVALILALEKIGLQVELWTEARVDSRPGGGGLTADIRCLVKGAGETLDVGQIMFAFASPAMARVITFGLLHRLPAKWRSALGVGKHDGYPGRRDDAPDDGSVYLPPPAPGRTESTLVVDTLRGLGIIA